MIDKNYHNGYHDPDCWCYDGSKGGGGNMGCLGTIFGAIAFFIGTCVVLTLIISAVGTDIDEIPSGVLTFLVILIMSVISTIASIFKK